MLHIVKNMHGFIVLTAPQTVAFHNTCSQPSGKLCFVSAKLRPSPRLLNTHFQVFSFFWLDLFAHKLQNQQKEKHYFTTRIAIYNNPFFEKDQFFRILLHKVCIYFDFPKIICARSKERMGVKAHFFYTWNGHKKTTCRFSKNDVSFL